MDAPKPVRDIASPTEGLFVVVRAYNPVDDEKILGLRVGEFVKVIDREGDWYVTQTRL
jgi:hypothetical protein